MWSLLDRVIDRVSREWHVIVQAKGLFGLALFLVAAMTTAVGWKILDWHYSGTLEVLQATIESQRDRIESLHSAVKSTNFPSLEKGTRLSPAQKNCLINKFRDTTELFLGIPIFFFPEGQNLAYASDFALIFERVGLTTAIISARTSSPDDTGLMVGLKDVGKPSDKAIKFMGLLETCGFKIKNVAWKNSDKINLGPQMKALDFDLFVGPEGNTD
jgi:hypothetical protein